MLENFLPEEKYGDEVTHLQKNGAYEIKIESTKFAGTTLTEWHVTTVKFAKYDT